MRPTHDQIKTFADRTIVILGDLMLDTFVYGDCVRISPEAPIPVLVIEREEVMLGGAGNVARNIAALDGQAILIGIVGEDHAGRDLRGQVASEPRIIADLVTDGRPTTRKIRYVAGQQQMLRADIECTHDATPEPLIAAVERYLPSADALVLSDYAKGVLTPTLLRRVIDLARTLGKPVIADPKSADIARYDGVDIVTPNAREATSATAISCHDDAQVDAAALRLLETMPASESVLITRGAQGMTLARRGQDPIHLPAITREVFDVSGAGDTVVASIALGLAAGLPVETAVELGNIAAGMAVSKAGTAVVTAEELMQELHRAQIDTSERKVVSPDEAVARVSRWRNEGLTIGFTNGCFDLIHPGHVSQLTQARAACDRLVVGLNSDASVKRLKGPNRPIQDEPARAIVLASLSMVDLVVLFGEDTPINLIEAIRPDVLVKGKDYTVDRVVGADFVQGYGGRIVLADLVPGNSTTGIVNRLRQPN